MMNVKEMRTETLRKLVDETEATLEELSAELERREEAEQHQEIDRLDEHFRNAELSLTAIRDFIAQALSDLRGRG
ncbi:hypothetical protein [Rubrimonas cliftonensis]|uniref:Uncharacterized protein n=1 Tax=Rubrimonas cliftonensis TaxID=89524 RepID=A0A1H4FMS5_9RHOB|nr:hypothetical protein [Rubrimonas cliftonensis]SEA98367.1 hypothetical protein SAMN05444370_12510 [Rubrimonas cliftonensis]